MRLYDGGADEHVHDYDRGEWQDDLEYHWNTCSCGETFNISEHEWDISRVIKGATTTEEGLLEYICPICRRTKTEATYILPEVETEPQPDHSDKPDDHPATEKPVADPADTTINDPADTTPNTPATTSPTDLPVTDQPTDSPEPDKPNEPAETSTDTNDVDKPLDFPVFLVAIIVLGVVGVIAILVVSKRKI